MTRTSAHRAVVLLAALALASSAGLPTANAHGPDSPGWIEQGGNGSGDSTPVASGLDIGAILYSKTGFAVNPGPHPRSLSKWLAWGTKDVGGQRRLFMQGSNDGAIWAPPIAATITDPNGVDVPFVLNPVGGFDVINTIFVDATFYIYYRAADQPDNTVLSLGRAWSTNGIEWNQDTPLSEVAAGSVVGGVGFKQKVVGVSQIIWNQGSTLTNAQCFAAANPYSCRVVLHYTTEDASGKRYSALARSGTGGTAFQGEAAPTLSPAPGGAWDDFRVEDMTMQAQPGGWRALYAGSRLGGRKSIGWATSANGLTFTRTGSGPATPATLFDAATPGGGTLNEARFVTEDGFTEHTHVYVSRGLGLTHDLFRASTAPAPTTAPHVRVSSPAEGAVAGPKVPLRIFAGDTLGANPGLDLRLLSITVDGAAAPSLTTDDTIVGQYALPGKRIDGSVTLTNGPHTLVATAVDRDGEITTVTVSFSVDGSAPQTTLTSSPSSMQVGFPDSIGTFRGTVVDPAGGTGIAYVSAVVTNPLGEKKSYSTHAPSGWQVSKVSADDWRVGWVAPALDPHFLLPGTYVVSILGTDNAQNAEKASTSNTVMVDVI